MMDTFNFLYLYLGLGGVLIAGLCAVAWFFPQWRKEVVIAIAGILGALALYKKGNKDGETRVQNKWDKAERKSVERGNKAHADAKRDVATGRVRDPWDRDDK